VSALTVGYALLLYAATGILVFGVAWKCRVYARTPQPLKIPIPPAPTTRGGVVLRMLLEVTLFRALALQASPNARGQYENFLDYARRHCEVVTRYGRFPHRNALLERPSTPDEEAYLAESAGF